MATANEPLAEIATEISDKNQMKTRAQLSTEMAQLAGVTLPQETEDVPLEQASLIMGTQPKQSKKRRPTRHIGLSPENQGKAMKSTSFAIIQQQLHSLLFGGRKHKINSSADLPTQMHMTYCCNGK